MKITSSILAALALAPAAVAAPALQAEVGASYFGLRDAQFEPGPRPRSVDEASPVAPFVAADCSFNDTFGLRLAYHHLDNLRAITQLGSPPGSQLPVIVWGHYDDEVHLASLAPELKWRVHPKVQCAIAPQLNWVASRGVVSYSTDNPAVLLIGPRQRRDDGFTLGAAAQVRWSLGSRAAVGVGYHYVDLSPSFDRRAHVVSGGLRWQF